jgi:hypothetical protein
MNDDLTDAIRQMEAILDPACKLFRRQQDFYKTLLTLNTTTLLISIAFSEKILRVPHNTLWALFPFIFFSLSLLCSLYMMRIFGDFDAYIVEYRIDLLNMVIAKKIDQGKIERLREKTSKIGTRANKLQGPALWFYFFGIISLIVFTVLNFIGHK